MISEAIIAAICTGCAAIFIAIGTLVTNIIKAKKEETKDTTLQNTHEETLIKLSQGSFNSVLEVSNQISQLQESFDEYRVSQRDINVILLRREILSIYYKYLNEKQLPEREFESVLNLYTVYKSQGGNSLVDTVVEEIKSWKRE